MADAVAENVPEFVFVLVAVLVPELVLLIVTAGLIEPELVLVFVIVTVELRVPELVFVMVAVDEMVAVLVGDATIEVEAVIEVEVVPAGETDGEVLPENVPDTVPLFVIVAEIVDEEVAALLGVMVIDGVDVAGPLLLGDGVLLGVAPTERLAVGLAVGEGEAWMRLV